MKDHGDGRPCERVKTHSDNMDVKGRQIDLKMKSNYLISYLDEKSN